MNTERKVIVGLVTLILVVGSFAGVEILRAHDADLVASTKQKVDDDAKATLNKAIADRDGALKAFQDQIAAQQNAVRTTPQAVQVIEHYVPSPAGQQPVVVQKSDLTPAEKAKLPDAPSYVVLTQDQAVANAKSLLQCDADQKGLQACRADLVDTQKKEAVAEQDAAMWEKTAKGGSRWQRLRSGAWHAGCGAAAGTVGAVEGNRNGAQVGAVSGAATFVGCEVVNLFR